MFLQSRCGFKCDRCRSVGDESGVLAIEEMTSAAIQSQLTAPMRLKCRAKHCSISPSSCGWPRPSDHVARGTCRLLFDDTNPTRTAWKAPSTTATTINAEAMSGLPLIKHMNAAAKTSPTPIARLFQVKTRFIWRSFDKQRTSVVDAQDCTCK